MKRLFCLLMTLTLGLTASAQQALWGGSRITSPEVHADGSVTFRCEAPEAREVVLSGDFLPAPQPLTRNEEGIWCYTTPPLPSDLYAYTFYIDGNKSLDLSNVYLIRDIASLANIFLVGGGAGDLYAVQDVPHGSITRCWYPSSELQRERRLSIYTPAGYAEGRERYPVLYLLHGMGGDEEAWLGLGRAAQILDNLIAQGKARPMIVVMTNGNIDQVAAPGESPLGLYKPTTRLPRTMDGTFESSFGDVIDYVDQHYRTLRKSSGRAIAGLSMGGFHAMHISRYLPRTFDYVGLFSAAVGREGKPSPVYERVDETLRQQQENGLRLYWIGCGREDFLWEDNLAYRSKLDAMGFPYTFRESDGGHTWKNWREYLTEFLPLLFQ